MSKLDKTPLLHATISTVFTAVVLLFSTELAKYACVAGAVWWIAREHTQAEYRWISRYGNGHRTSMPWWGGFDIRVWDVGSALDLAVPLVTSYVTFVTLSSI